MIKLLVAFIQIFCFNDTFLSVHLISRIILNKCHDFELMSQTRQLSEFINTYQVYNCRVFIFNVTIITNSFASTIYVTQAFEI